MTQAGQRRLGFHQSNTAPGVLFLAGALLFPAFLLQQDIVIRALQVVLFLALQGLAGKRVRPVQYLVIAAGIIVFNLVIPSGRILLELPGLLGLPGLPITESALKGGILKATAMTGLMAISRFSIRSDVQLPGRLGGLIGTSLFYFEKIMEGRSRVRRADIISGIDQVLLDIQAAGAPDPSVRVQRSVTSRGALFALTLIVLLNWAALALSMVHPHLLWG
jgi:hypothetical protein